MGSLWSNVNLANQVLSAQLATQTIRTANIANAGTPNYAAKVPTFEVRGNKVILNVDSSTRKAEENGNNVQMEQEMAGLTENSLRYLTTLKLLKKEMGLMRYAVTGGGA